MRRPLVLGLRCRRLRRILQTCWPHRCQMQSSKRRLSACHLVSCLSLSQPERMLRCKWAKGLTLWCCLRAAMRTAMASFPALDDADAHAEAQQLLQACAAGSMEPWTAVLALLLGDSDTLAGVSPKCMQQATASAPLVPTMNPTGITRRYE